jgi:hypothetical protein
MANKKLLKASKFYKEKVLQLKVTLCGSKPLVWRRIQVSAEMDFHSFHLLLQEAMGWQNCHLYAFRVGDIRIVGPECDSEGFGEKLLNSLKVKLSGFIAIKGKKLVYKYDFGDCWEHGVVVEKVLGLDEAQKRLPLCLDGAMNCPPEDSGGVWGFYDLLAAAKNPKHKEHHTFKEWLGEFDCEHFSVSDVNTSIQRVFG